MSAMDVLSIVFGVGFAALVVWLMIRYSPESYLREYDEASRKDMAYYQEHPDCTLEEAHRNRDRVNRKFLK